MIKSVQSWRETQTINLKCGDVIYVPEIKEWHPVGAVSIINGKVNVWYGLSSHAVVITRETTKVAI